MIKEIAGFPGYFVTDDGRVLSNRRGPEKELKLQRHKGGYLIVGLCRDGVNKKFLVHQLVAIAFIPNPNNYTEVNHKDENKTNNCVENLEWCTHLYNVNYGTRNKRASEALAGENHPRYGKYTTPKVYCKELDKTFESYRACNLFMAKYLGLKQFNVSVYIKKYKGYHNKYKLHFYEV